MRTTRLRSPRPVGDMLAGRDDPGPAVQRLSAHAQLRRQVVDLYRRGAVPPLLSLLCACGLVGLLWPVLPGLVAGSWLLAHGVVTAGRLLLVRRFNGERVGDGQLLRWRAHYVNATLVGGLVWGVGSVLLVVGKPHVLQLFAWVCSVPLYWWNFHLLRGSDGLMRGF